MTYNNLNECTSCGSHIADPHSPYCPAQNTGSRAAARMRAANVIFDANQGNIVNTNASDDYWHGRGDHAYYAADTCAHCVAEGNTRGFTITDLQRRVARLALVATHRHQGTSLYSADAAVTLQALIAARYGITTTIENTGGNTMVQTVRVGNIVFTLAGETIADAVVAVWSASDWDGETQGEALLLDSVSIRDAAAHVRIALDVHSRANQAEQPFIF